jgi:hypothetical protein
MQRRGKELLELPLRSEQRPVSELTHVVAFVCASVPPQISGFGKHREKPSFASI